MAVSESSKSPVIDPKTLYHRTRLGKSTFSDGSINVPKQVIDNYTLKKGDVLEWFPCATDFPDNFEPDVLAVLVVRKKNIRKKKK